MKHRHLGLRRVGKGSCATFASLFVVLTLAACGENPQSAQTNRHDEAAYSGAGKSSTNSFTTPGWTAGDKTSWESQLKARTQYGQNDFSRMQ